MLTFVGLGLYDERSITVEGRDTVRSADDVFLETYTSRLAGATIEDLESYHGVEITERRRADVERDPEAILRSATEGDAVFLTAGDPMIATTHIDLRLRAAERGIETRIVHGTSAQSAASGLTGLQNYRFGKATTLPFPDGHGSGDVPDSVIETLEGNRRRDLHTLVYLDIKADRDAYLSADRAAEALAGAYEDVLAVAVARAGSPEPVVEADRLSALADRDFGDPLHLLVVPGELHRLESEALRTFADAPPDIAPIE